MIDASDFFPSSPDSYTFTPYLLPSSEVVYTVSNSKVQEETSLTVFFETPVPFTYDGCYFRFRFPDELVIDSASLNSFEVDYYLLNELGGTQAVPVDQDLEADEKYIIMKGCQYNSNSQLTQKYV